MLNIKVFDIGSVSEVSGPNLRRASNFDARFDASFAILLPPLGVFLERGCNSDFVSDNCRLLPYCASFQSLLVHQHSSRESIRASPDGWVQMMRSCHAICADHPGLHVRISNGLVYCSVLTCRCYSPGIIHGEHFRDGLLRRGPHLTTRL